MEFKVTLKNITPTPPPDPDTKKSHSVFMPSHDSSPLTKAMVGGKYGVKISEGLFPKKFPKIQWGVGLMEETLPDPKLKPLRAKFNPADYKKGDSLSYSRQAFWNLSMTTRRGALEPKTQKAKSLLYLICYGGRLFPYPTHGVTTISEDYLFLIKNEKDLEIFTAGLPKERDYFIHSKGPYFARPCPLTPRPGFVDSRDVTTAKEVKEVWKEIKKVEPEGELVIMAEKHEATTSAIYVPESGLLFLGRDNDGATLGRETCTIPTVAGSALWYYSPKMDASFKEMAGITKSPHLELVYNRRNQPFVVQVRDAEEISTASVDYIPEDTVVSKVITCNIDDTSLLEWEEQVKELGDDIEGVVANFPGASIGSHYALHCISANIPVVVSKEVEIGEELQAPAQKVFYFNKELFIKGRDLAADFVPDLFRYLEGGGLPSVDVIRDLAGSALAIFYNHTRLTVRKDWSFLLGWACKTLALLGEAACVGEFRYAPGKAFIDTDDPSYTAPDHHSKIATLKKHGAELGFTFSGTSLDQTKAGFRYRVWSDHLQGTEAERQARLQFMGPYLSQDWMTGGFGGPAWGEVLTQTMLLNHALENPNRSEIVSQTNTLVHTAHNGGVFFNKFLRSDCLEVGDKNPGALMAAFPHFPCALMGGFPYEGSSYKGTEAAASEGPLEEEAFKIFVSEDKRVHVTFHLDTILED